MSVLGNKLAVWSFCGVCVAGVAMAGTPAGRVVPAASAESFVSRPAQSNGSTRERPARLDLRDRRCCPPPRLQAPRHHWNFHGRTVPRQTSMSRINSPHWARRIGHRRDPWAEPRKLPGVWFARDFPSLVSRPRESHPQPLAELYVTLARHTAPVIGPRDDKDCQWINSPGR